MFQPVSNLFPMFCAEFEDVFPSWMFDIDPNGMLEAVGFVDGDLSDNDADALFVTASICLTRDLGHDRFTLEFVRMEE